jgi:cardiolipin synthase A/B
MRGDKIQFRPHKFPPFLRLCLATVLLLPYILSCVSVPDIDRILQELPNDDRPPYILGENRPLTVSERKEELRKLEEQAEPTCLLDRHVKVMEFVSGRPLIGGNKVTLLQDGREIYTAMMSAMRNARDHINLETFIFKDDEIGNGFANLLLQKQAEGVQVNIIYDSLGSFKTSRKFFRRLEAAGIRVLEFNPISLTKPGRLLKIDHRDHRKMLVVDGSVAFTGGVNIVRIYAKVSGGPRKGELLEWRDASVRIEGPAVAEFQKLFLETWQREQGPPLPERRYFTPLSDAGDVLVRVIGSSPRQAGFGMAYFLYMSAIKYSRSYIHLTNAYFIPDPQMLDALKEAAGRGVEVKILGPGLSDTMLTFHASRYHYRGLLEAGVKIYERKAWCSIRRQQ